jgi:small-conductance mechanosensitive channel
VLREPAPVVAATALGEYAIRIAIKPWVAVQDFGAAAGEINPAVVQAFRLHGVTIPVLATPGGFAVTH